MFGISAKAVLGPLTIATMKTAEDARAAPSISVFVSKLVNFESRKGARELSRRPEKVAIL
jgi:hypothetical protein